MSFGLEIAALSANQAKPPEPSPPPQAATPPPVVETPPIPAPAALAEQIAPSDAAAMRARLGRWVVSSGKVEKLDATKGGTQKIYLSGAEVFIVIEAKDFKATAGWDLPALVGKEIYVKGKVRDYYKKTAIAIAKPSQLAESLEKLPPDEALAALMPNQADGATPGQPPVGFAIKLERASLSQLRLVATGEKENKVVKLEMESFDLTWTKASGTTRIKTESTSQKAQSASGLAAQFITATHGGVWAGGKMASITKGPGMQSGVFPTAVTATLLVESTIGGFTIPPQTLITGNMLGSGALEGGANEVGRWLGTAALPNATLLAPMETAICFADAAVAEQWEALTRRVIVVKDVGEARQALQDLAAQKFDPAFSFLASVATDLTTKGPAGLKVAEIKPKAAALAQRFPQIPSLQSLSLVLQGKAPRVFSSKGSALRLTQFHNKIALDRNRLSTDDPENRKQLKAYGDEVAALVPKLDPKWKPFAAQLRDAIETLRDASRYEPKDESPRAKKTRADMEAAWRIVREQVISVKQECGE